MKVKESLEKYTELNLIIDKASKEKERIREDLGIEGTIAITDYTDSNIVFAMGDGCLYNMPLKLIMNYKSYELDETNYYFIGERELLYDDEGYENVETVIYIIPIKYLSKLTITKMVMR